MPERQERDWAEVSVRVSVRPPVRVIKVSGQEAAAEFVRDSKAVRCRSSEEFRREASTTLLPRNIL